MFGYVKPHVPELRVGEYELFRAVYCGVCRSMGRHTGTVSRFTLNYDYVFLAAVRPVNRSDINLIVLIMPVGKNCLRIERDLRLFFLVGRRCPGSDLFSRQGMHIKRESFVIPVQHEGNRIHTVFIAVKEIAGSCIQVSCHLI